MTFHSHLGMNVKMVRLLEKPAFRVIVIEQKSFLDDKEPASNIQNHTAVMHSCGTF